MVLSGFWPPHDLMPPGAASQLIPVVSAAGLQGRLCAVPPSNACRHPVCSSDSTSRLPSDVKQRTALSHATTQRKVTTLKDG